MQLPAIPQSSLGYPSTCVDLGRSEWTSSPCAFALRPIPCCANKQPDSGGLFIENIHTIFWQISLFEDLTRRRERDLQVELTSFSAAISECFISAPGETGRIRYTMLFLCIVLAKDKALAPGRIVSSVVNQYDAS